MEIFFGCMVDAHDTLRVAGDSSCGGVEIQCHNMTMASVVLSRNDTRDLAMRLLQWLEETKE